MQNATHHPQTIIVTGSHYGLDRIRALIARARLGSSARLPGDWPEDRSSWKLEARRTAADADVELARLDPGEHFGHPELAAGLEQLSESRRRAIGWCEGCGETGLPLRRWRFGKGRPRHRALWCHGCAHGAALAGLALRSESPD